MKTNPQLEVRDDWHVFTKDKIWGVKIEALKAEKEEKQARIKEINGLLKSHSSKF